MNVTNKIVRGRKIPWPNLTYCSRSYPKLPEATRRGNGRQKRSLIGRFFCRYDNPERTAQVLTLHWWFRLEESGTLQVQQHSWTSRVRKQHEGHHQCICYCGYMAVTVITAEYMASDRRAACTNCLGNRYSLPSDLVRSWSQYAISHEDLTSRQVKHSNVLRVS
jgi:hypothetical protein